MRLYGIVDESIVDGPGIRLAIFFQGCSHHCFKCHNPNSWDFEKGKKYSLEKIEEIIRKDKHIDGVTLTGGDPLDQYEEALSVCKMIKEKFSNLDIILYTGYDFEDVKSNFNEILNYIDYLVDGKFIYEKMDLSLLFKGSSNQRFIDVKKSLKQNKIYEMSDLEINMI